MEAVQEISVENSRRSSHFKELIFWKVVATDVEEQAGVPPLEEQEKYFRHHWQRFVEYGWAANDDRFHKTAVG